MTDSSPAALHYVRSTEPFETAAGRIASAVERIAAERGRARLALSGGSAARVAPLAAEFLRRRGFDFAKLWITWVDERCVSPSSSDANQLATRFEPVPGRVLSLFHEGEEPAAAVARVAAELESSFEGAIDIALLGMGGDGHVASLFVGRPPLEGSVAHVADSPKPPADRITLTRKMLETASDTILVTAGEGKREALERLRAGDRELPATGLPGFVLITDLEL